MEDKILRIVIARLKKYGEAPINADRLTEIRGDVFKATRTNKFASFSNVKKWVKAARNEMRKSAKASPKAAPAKKDAKRVQPHARSTTDVSDFEAPSMSRSIELSVNNIKEESPSLSTGQEVSMAKPTIIFDKVYLQSIKFEIAGIRTTMERVSRQLDRLEKELTSKDSK